jgi:acyl-CoA dehydrogenase
MTDAETIQQLRRNTRGFVARELEPLEAAVEEADRVPDGVREKLGELGYFGLAIPPEYGGSGLDVSGCCAIVEEFGRTHSAFFSLIDDNIGMGSRIILTQGTEPQRRRYLPDIAAGRAISCFALTEPGAGSDAAALHTVAVRDGDGYLLNGRKHFISNACHARYFNVIARTRPVGEADGRLAAFVVERGSRGFTIGRREPMMGLRGTCQHELIFEDCRIPAGNRLGAEGEGLRAAFEALGFGRLIVAAWSIGAAERALELGIAYARDRVQFGQPIGRFQGVQWLIADSATELFAARAMLRESAAAFDAGTARRREAGMVKLFATEMAGRVADRMLQVHGGAGYSKGLPLERIYRDVRVQRIIEGTSEIQRMIIARSLLREAGMDRE